MGAEIGQRSFFSLFETDLNLTCYFATASYIDFYRLSMRKLATVTPMIMPWSLNRKIR